VPSKPAIEAVGAVGFASMMDNGIGMGGQRCIEIPFF
jgi:hypothetical protein